MVNRENIIKNREIYTPGASDEEFAHFLYICETYDFDPALRHIHFQKYRNKKTGEMTATIYITRDGLLHNAQKNKDFEGIISFAVYEKDIFEVDAQNYKITHKFSVNRGKLVGAWAQVNRKNLKPFITFVPLSEYFDEKSYTWKKYTSSMIKKVAEAIVLKRAFEITGVYTQEELPLSVLEEQIPQKKVSEKKKISLPKPKEEVKESTKEVDEEPREPVKNEEPKVPETPAPKKSIKLKINTPKKEGVKEESKTAIPEIIQSMDIEMAGGVLGEMRGNDWFVSETAKTRIGEDLPLFFLRLAVSKTEHSDGIEEQFEKELSQKPRDQTLVQTYLSSIEDYCIANNNETIDLSEFVNSMEKYISELKKITDMFAATSKMSEEGLLNLIQQRLNIPEKLAHWGVKYLLKRGFISKKKKEYYPAGD